MTRALVIQSWTQIFGSPVRMAVLAAWFGLPLLMMAAEGSARLDASMTTEWGLAILAGLCGLDASNGNLRCILGRPVSRAGYVVARFAAGWSAMAALGLVNLLLQAALVATFGGEGPPGARAAAFVALHVVVGSTALTGAVVLASVAVQGLGDVVLLTLGAVALALVREFGPDAAWAGYVADVIMALIGRVDPTDGVALGGLRALSSAALALLLAVVVLNRKEIGGEARA